MIDFGSIGQFREVIKTVQESTQYVGKDEEGKPIFDYSLKAPIIKVTGTEKLHGTNMGVSYSNMDGLWVQSRNNIITTDSDNAGCAFYVVSNQAEWVDIITLLAKEYNINLDENIITVYAEWAGGNIQKNSAVSGLEKSVFIFEHFKVSPIDADTKNPSIWLRTVVGENPISNNDKRIYNVLDYPSYEIEIDFNSPLLAQNKMIELVESIVEPSSPLGKMFGFEENVGEGIVWTFPFKDSILRFKTKGEKHSSSKVKTLKAVDDAKEQAKIDFANYATPSWRLEQMWQNVFGIDGDRAELSMKSMGLFLKAVMADIVKEESDLMVERGLEPKDVGSKVSNIARVWFQENLDRELTKNLNA